jgi:hypothetical protein
MTDANLDPFSLVFGDLADLHFPPIRDALAEDRSIEAFMLSAPALDLMGRLRPDDGLGDAADDFVAFVYAAWRFWCDGKRVVVLDEKTTRARCTPGHAPVPAGDASGPETTRYIQVTPRLVWGRLASDETYEPLDGWFATRSGPVLRVVACFGLHSARPGLSVVVAQGPWPGAVAREDGSAIFSPMMPGGDLAGLHAVAAPEELLLLAWRAEMEDVG